MTVRELRPEQCAACHHGAEQRNAREQRLARRPEDTELHDDSSGMYAIRCGARDSLPQKHCRFSPLFDTIL